MKKLENSGLDFSKINFDDFVKKSLSQREELKFEFTKNLSDALELISEAGNMPPGYDKLLPAYDEALKLYRGQEWEKAIDAFKASDELEDMFGGRKTNPSRIYIPRCEHYRDNPPGDDWDGSWALTKK